MNIYVETNFVLELVFEQEQYASCENILKYCEAGLGSLVLPAYCLAEPHEKLVRQANRRKELLRQFELEMQQMSRRTANSTYLGNLRGVVGMLALTNDEEEGRFRDVRARLLKTAELIPLNHEIVSDAASQEDSKSLSAQDALVYASICWHLRKLPPVTCCFLNRNSKDFRTPDVVQELDAFSCRVISNFEQGLSFIRAKSKT